MSGRPGRAARAAWGATLALAALAGPTLSSPASAEEAAPIPTVPELLDGLAALPGLEARFREEKRIVLLAAPLVSEGTIHFARPGRLARHTLRPARASVVIDRGVLRFGDERGEERLDLASSPALALFVQSFVAVLGGDRAVLERLYDLSIGPWGEGGWQLALAPREAALRRVLRGVTVRGRALALEQVTVAEVSGDETVTTFTEVRTDRRYGEAEAARVFSLTPTR